MKTHWVPSHCRTVPSALIGVALLAGACTAEIAGEDGGNADDRDPSDPAGIPLPGSPEQAPGDSMGDSETIGDPENPSTQPDDPSAPDDSGEPNDADDDPSEPGPPSDPIDTVGDEQCDGGLANSGGTVCCPLACGTCGGTGCEERPGGAGDCCAGEIMSSSQYCDAAPPPCILGSEPEPTQMTAVFPWDAQNIRAQRRYGEKYQSFCRCDFVRPSPQAPFSHTRALCAGRGYSASGTERSTRCHLGIVTSCDRHAMKELF